MIYAAPRSAGRGPGAHKLPGGDYLGSMTDRGEAPPAAPSRARRWSYIVASVIVVAAIAVSIAIITSRGDEVADPLFSKPTGSFDDVGTNARAYETVEDVTAAMTAGGITCSSLEEQEPDGVEKEQARCIVGEDDVIIRTFTTLADRNRHLESSRAFLDEADIGVAPLPSVVGPTWLVTTDSKATADKLRKVIGGATLD